MQTVIGEGGRGGDGLLLSEQARKWGGSILFSLHQMLKVCLFHFAHISYAGFLDSLSGQVFMGQVGNWQSHIEHQPAGYFTCYPATHLKKTGNDNFRGQAEFLHM